MAPKAFLPAQPRYDDNYCSRSHCIVERQKWQIPENFVVYLDFGPHNLWLNGQQDLALLHHLKDILKIIFWNTFSLSIACFAYGKWVTAMDSYRICSAEYLRMQSADLVILSYIWITSLSLVHSYKLINVCCVQYSSMNKYEWVICSEMLHVALKFSLTLAQTIVHL